ncbi:MAG: hypothetical protein QW228_03425 [Candidatus Aenigmatarchaeota archaeon]
MTGKVKPQQKNKASALKKFLEHLNSPALATAIKVVKYETTQTSGYKILQVGLISLEYKSAIYYLLFDYPDGNEDAKIMFEKIVIDGERGTIERFPSFTGIVQLSKDNEIVQEIISRLPTSLKSENQQPKQGVFQTGLFTVQLYKLLEVLAKPAMLSQFTLYPNRATLSIPLNTSYDYLTITIRPQNQRDYYKASISLSLSINYNLNFQAYGRFEKYRELFKE